MSLYYEAASFIGPHGSPSDSLRLSVYAGNQKLKNPPGKIFALLSETLKWNSGLKTVIENAEVLKAERKITPELSLVLVHDLLFRPKGIEAPATHPLRSAIERHKTRLGAELTKLRVRNHCSTLDDLKEAFQHGSIGQQVDDPGPTRPRWIRINRVCTTLDEQLKTTFKEFKQVKKLSEVTETQAITSIKPLYVDEHIPDLIAVPIQTELDVPAYRDGKIILQDKASCFPAYMLNPQPGQITIDACAAPGNKTTHLASLLARSGKPPSKSIYAIERDTARSKLLQNMVDTANATSYVVVKSAQDFLRLDPNNPEFPNEPWMKAEALLLDPSCSGSGIVGREEGVSWNLPAAVVIRPEGTNKKRKRGKAEAGSQDPKKQRVEETLSGNVPITGEEDKIELEDRLNRLVAFQLRVIRHAFRFPNAKRIVYSTCSVHNKENEDCVLMALTPDSAAPRGWHILPRNKQPDGMRDWPIRGNSADYPPFRNFKDKKTIIDSVIRCNKNDEHGTQGFFVAAFERD